MHPAHPELGGFVLPAHPRSSLWAAGEVLSPQHTPRPGWQSRGVPWPRGRAQTSLVPQRLQGNPRGSSPGDKPEQSSL